MGKTNNVFKRYDRIKQRKHNPAHKILVLIAFSSNEGSGETGQMCRLVRHFAAHILMKFGGRGGLDQNLDSYCTG